MTNQQFLDNVLLEYDKVSNGSLPGYTAAELSMMATEALERLITTKYSPKSNRLGEGFEETEKRIQDLGEYVRYRNIITFTTGFFDNAYYVTLPNTLITVGPTDYSDVYWYTIFEEVTTNQLDCTIPGNTTVYVKADVNEVSHGELKDALRNPFRKPFVKNDEGRVLRLRSEGRQHQLITDGTFTISSYRVGYIRKPEPIDLTGPANNQVCLLSDSAQRELVNETVQVALRNIQSLQQLQVETQIIKE